MVPTSMCDLTPALLFSLLLFSVGLIPLTVYFNSFTLFVLL